MTFLSYNFVTDTEHVYFSWVWLPIVSLAGWLHSRLWTGSYLGLLLCYYLLLSWTQSLAFLLTHLSLQIRRTLSTGMLLGHQQGVLVFPPVSQATSSTRLSDDILSFSSAKSTPLLALSYPSSTIIILRVRNYSIWKHVPGLLSP